MAEVSASAANIREAVPFFNVADMAQSLRFYEAGLGFEVTHRWIDEGLLRWCALRRDGVSIMLQAYRPDRRPEGAPGVGVSICFMCDDAIAVWREARARGLSPARPFVGNGLWVTGFTDPDGYRLDFESPTDAEEESEYAGD
ncbi:VOC family protein [Phenylobacterium sp. J426]|uniref:VOC family protein n=1 Tax=Phenylobacterium sp. J426 TaxID=2898439 RepID=UPI002151C852|nr:VOC family protein [Phenylobacterium sp. J426]MCR5873340.1 VOC family protein [Phenylobacterium sp. J426]